MGPIFYVFVLFFIRLTPQGFVFDLPPRVRYRLPLCGSLSLTTWDRLLP